MSRGVLLVFCLCFRVWGHAGLARGPGVAAWGRGLPCFPAAADLGERLVRVRDRAEPGRRGRRRRASLRRRAVSR